MICGRRAKVKRENSRKRTNEHRTLNAEHRTSKKEKKHSASNVQR